MIIEKVVRDYLIRKNIPGIGSHVYAEVPITHDFDYILIEKTGSGTDNMIYKPTIVIQSIATLDHGLYRAMEINEAVKAAMETIRDEEGSLFSCRLSSDYNYTKTGSKEYRYQAVYTLAG